MFLKNPKGDPNSKTVTIFIKKNPFPSTAFLTLTANPEHFNSQFPVTSLNTSLSFLSLSYPPSFLYLFIMQIDLNSLPVEKNPYLWEEKESGNWSGREFSLASRVEK